MFYIIWILTATLNSQVIGPDYITYTFQLKDSLVPISNGYVSLSGGNGTVFNKSGYPALPFYEYILPSLGDITNAKETKKEIITKSGVYVPLPQFGKNEMIKGYFPKKQFYDKNTFFPSKDFDISEVNIRGGRFYRIRIYPVKFNPKARKIILTRSLSFKVSFKKGKNVYKGPFLFKNIIKNPLYFKETPYKPLVKASVFDSGLIWFKIPITKSGAYKVPYNTLKNKGLYASFSTSSIALYSRGPDTLISDLSKQDFYMRKIPILVKDENANGRFDGDDYIVFYAEGPFSWKKSDTTYVPYHNPYTDTTFYWLGFGKSGKMMDTLPYSDAPSIEDVKAFLHHEIDKTNIAWKGLLWLGEEVIRLQGSPEGDRDFSFNISNASKDSAVLRIRLAGGEGIKRSIEIITQNLQDSFTFSGYNIVKRTLSPVKVQNGENTFKVKIFKIANQDDSYGDQVYVDYYDVIYNTYPETRANEDLFVKGNGNFTFCVQGNIGYVFNIQDPLNPYLLEIREKDGKYFVHDTTRGLTRYYVAKDLKVPDIYLSQDAGRLYNTDYSKTDMLIITKERLIPSLWKYKSYRETHFPVLVDSLWTWGKGNIKIIAVEDIYRDFGFGSHDPVSIRNFVHYAYENSMQQGTPHLKFLLMVGDGTYDYRGIETKEGNIIPPYEPYETADINDYREAIENFYPDMNGDGYPDLFYGRVPVRTSYDVATYFNKIISYEEQPSTSFYRQRVLLVADDERGPSGGDGEAFWHVPQAEVLYTSYTPRQAEKITVYETDFGTAQDPQERGELAKNAFVNAMNMGNLIMAYYGHGNPVQMSHEMLFTINDVNLINTHGKPPLCVVLTCKFGAFSRIEPERVIAEDWTLNPEGVLGVIASPHATFVSSNSTTGRNIFSIALSGKKHPLGEITLAGQDPNYFLLGDPTVLFYYPSTDSILHISSQSDTIKSGELSHVYIHGAYTGDLLTEIIGQPKIKTYHTYPNNLELVYHTNTPVLFRGDLNKAGDTSVFPFFLPINADTGTIYVNTLRTSDNMTKEATGIFHLSKGTQGHDIKGPSINVLIGGKTINEDETVNTPLCFLLEADIEDSYGINLQGVGEEKGLYLLIDNTTYDLAPYFKYDRNSYTKGKVYYNVNIENEGEHNLSVVAYDNGENRSQKTFRIYAEEASQKLSSVLIYPNPIRGKEGAHITFSLEKGAYVQLSIFSISGTLIYKTNKDYYPSGFSSIYWDGRDMFGDLPSSGLYIVVLTVDTDGVKSKTTKGLFIERR